MLTLITRRECHLCEDMAAVVGQVTAETLVDSESRDVDGDEGLRAQYGDEVPVLLVNGRKAFKYRVTVGELRRRINAERRRQWLRHWRWLASLFR